MPGLPASRFALPKRRRSALQLRGAPDLTAKMETKSSIPKPGKVAADYSQPMRPLEEVVLEISRLPENWHAAGSVTRPVLEAIVRYAADRTIVESAESGSGKTTLLFSHLSARHRVFALEGDNRSITAARNSPLLRPGVVEFIEGPTQLTLPNYRFPTKLQLALIDGPHGFPFPELEYYYFYPHLDARALLLVDDIQIPTIFRLFEILKEDSMFNLLEVVENTAFFERTEAPVFSPVGDGWWLQPYNKRRFPVAHELNRLRRICSEELIQPIKRALKGNKAKRR